MFRFGIFTFKAEFEACHATAFCIFTARENLQNFDTIPEQSSLSLKALKEQMVKLILTSNKKGITSFGDGLLETPG